MRHRAEFSILEAEGTHKGGNLNWSSFSTHLQQYTDYLATDCHIMCVHLLNLTTINLLQTMAKTSYWDISVTSWFRRWCNVVIWNSRVGDINTPIIRVDQIVKSQYVLVRVYLSLYSRLRDLRERAKREPVVS